MTTDARTQVVARHSETGGTEAGQDRGEGDVRPAKRRTRLVLTLVAIALLGVGLWAMYGRKKGGGEAATGPAASGSAARVVPVQVATAALRDVPIYLEGLGNATALQTVAVKSQVDGRLDKVLFKEGQPVKRGDVLAQVDPRPFTIQLHQAEAALSRDSAQLRNAKLNLDRFKTLRSQNLIPQSQVDDQQTLVDQTESSVKSDQTQIDNARLQLDYARITSPIDGVTGVRQVDPGNLVHASDATGIVIITQLDPIAVIFTLPQDDLPAVAKELAAGTIPVEAWSRDGATKLGSGSLALVDNQINTATATIRLKAVLPNSPRTLWPNAFVKARLLLHTRQGAIVVPAPAVQRGPQGTFVYVVGPDQTVSLRPIEIDLTQGDLAIVRNGVAPGDVVVTDGQNQLKPGSKVAPRGGPASAPAGSGPAAPGAPGAPASAGSAPAGGSSAAPPAPASGGPPTRGP